MIGERIKKKEDKFGNVVENAGATRGKEIDARIQALEEKEHSVFMNSNVTEIQQRGCGNFNLILFNIDECISEDAET